MRSVRSEFVSVTIVLATMFGVVMTVPVESLFFKARVPGAPAARVAFVTLNAEEERQALRAARSSWRGEAGGAERAELFFSELPEGPRPDSLSVGLPERRAEPAVVDAGLSPFLPSRKAAAPMKVSSERAPEPMAFPKDELLRIE